MKKPMLYLLILLLATSVMLALLSRQKTEAQPAMAHVTATPTIEPTEASTATPTAEPTETPTVMPTLEPTDVPTAEPTTTSVVTPSAEPKDATLTDLPTAEPTPEAVGDAMLPLVCG